MSQKEPAYYGYELKKVPYNEYIRSRTDTPLWRKVLARFIIIFFTFLSGLIMLLGILFDPEILSFLLILSAVVLFCFVL